MALKIAEKSQRAQPHVEHCPRCRHLSCFMRASSDGAWVCQRCLRYRCYEPRQTAPASHPSNSKA